MKTMVENIIRLRNPHFKFDANLTNYALWAFVWVQVWAILRGLMLYMYGKNPKGAILAKGVQFFNLPQIHWGKFLKLGKGVYISALGKEGVFLGNHVSIGDYSRVVVSTSLHQVGKFIHIGDNVGIGEFAYLGGGGGLEIGNDCIIGQYFSCHPENHHFNELQIPIRHQGISRQGIKIGRDCWIGSKVTILDGVEIGKGCVIAAGAVVTQSFPPFSVIGGVPAKLLKTRDLKTISTIKI
jgi:acetyltransferase-like isoleucine patch superfamily enzyme